MPRLPCSLTLIAMLLLGISGCERSPAPSAASKPVQTRGAASQPGTASTQPSADELANVRQFMRENEAANPPTLPSGHPPINQMPTSMSSTLMPEPPAAPLKYDLPPSWPAEPVSSSMRVAQYRLPHAPGDAEDGELAVFTGIGGGVDANVNLWRSQFTTADGQPIPETAFTRESFEAHGLKVTLVDITGRHIRRAMMPGAAVPAPKDGYRMLGAIVETPAGPWFFKAVGPQQTIAEQRPAFIELLKSVSME